MRAEPTVPTHLPTPPDAVLTRLARQGLALHSVWFPTRADIARWNRSGCPLYVRRRGDRRALVGPRLGNMWASAFSPVLELQLSTDGAGTRVHVRRRLEPVTLTVLALWSVLLAGWAIAFAIETSFPGGVWLLLVVATVSAPIVGWVQGGRALDAGIPWLTEVLLAPDDLEDW